MGVTICGSWTTTTSRIEDPCRTKLTGVVNAFQVIYHNATSSTYRFRFFGTRLLSTDYTNAFPVLCSYSCCKYQLSCFPRGSGFYNADASARDATLSSTPAHAQMHRSIRLNCCGRLPIGFHFRCNLTVQHHGSLVELLNFLNRTRILGLLSPSTPVSCARGSSLADKGLPSHEHLVFYILFCKMKGVPPAPHSLFFRFRVGFSWKITVYP